jgi:hypothetical protein
LIGRANQAHSVALPGPLTDLLTGHKVKEQVTLEVKGVMILR